MEKQIAQRNQLLSSPRSPRKPGPPSPPPSKVIRDNIHGYIALTELERNFLALPEFQRLHFVSQNGLTFHTYPATKHTRFLHSLGSMHLAGSMVLSAMRKGGPGVQSFRVALTEYIDSFRPALRGVAQWLSTSDQLYADLGIQGDWLMCVMFQSVRIASLIHDVGHPPFSHTVEQAMEQMLSPTPADGDGDTPNDPHAESDDLGTAVKALESGAEGLHEQIGEYVIRKQMLPTLTGDAHTSGSPLVELAVDISVHYSRNGALRALKGVVAGEFDCDRADYVVRDCTSAGVDFGGYDLRRILPAMSVVQCGDQWYFRPALRSLPAIESFYEERLKLYRWIIYHHSCQRSHIALQRATIYAIRLYEGTGGFKKAESRALRDAVEPITRLWNFPSYHQCDEGWYFSFLAQLLSAVTTHIKVLDDRGEEPSRALLNLWGFGHQARWREKNMSTLWKRVDEYRAFCEGVAQTPIAEGGLGLVLDDDTSLIPAVNSWLEDRLDKVLKRHGIVVMEWIEGELEKRFNVPFALNLIQWKPVGVERSLKRLPRPDAGVFVVDEEVEGCNSLIPLGRISPVPNALQTVWENSIHLRAYVLQWVVENPISPSPSDFGQAFAKILGSGDFHRFSPASAAQPDISDMKEEV